TLATPVHLLAANVADTNAFSGVLQQGRTYYWQVVAKNAVGNSGGCTIHVFATTPPDQVLVLKAFLQGLYIGNRTMRAGVNPSLYPNVADTIRVSLARSVPPYDILYTTKALLSTSGVARCSFPNSS